MATQIKLRRDTYQNWYDNNPILGLAEPGFDTTNKKLKIGDGTTDWRTLPYFDDKETVLSAVTQDIIPATDNTYDLGTPSMRWRHGYFATGSLYVGDIKLSNNAGKLEITKVINPGEENEEPDPTDSNAGDSVTSKLTNGEHEFKLESDGTLSLDGSPYSGGGGGTATGVQFANAGSITQQGPVNTSRYDIKIDAERQVQIFTDEGNHSFLFKENGGLEFPDGTTQTTAYTGQSGSTGDQNIWIQTFLTDTPETDRPGSVNSVEYDADGNIIALFLVYPPQGGDNYTALAKFTSTGTKLWQVRFDGSGSTDGWGVAVDSQNGFIYVTARTTDPMGYDRTTVTQFSLADGSINWSKVYDFGYASTSGVIDAFNGDAVFVGYANTATDNQVTVVKIAGEDGSVYWAKGLDGQGMDEAYGMAIGSSGEVVVIGYMSQLGESGDTEDRMLVAKYNSDGTLAWQKAVLYDATYNCNGADADIDSAGNIYVCGQYQKDNGQGGTDTAMNLVKFNSSGVAQWSRRVVGDCATFAASVVVGPDDYLYLSGIAGTAATSDFACVIAKYEQNGQVAWQRLLDNVTTWSFAGSFYTNNGGGSNIDVKDGYVVIGGGFGDPGTGAYAMMAQLDTAGTMFAVDNWDYKQATFSGFLNTEASDITVDDALKTDGDLSGDITVTDFSPDTDTSNFLVPTIYRTGDSGTITFSGNNIRGDGSAEDAFAFGRMSLIPNNGISFTDNGQYIDIYPTIMNDAPHIHIAAGKNAVAGQGDLILGDDNHHVDVNHSGQIKIRAFDSDTSLSYDWQFNNDGSLASPSGSWTKTTNNNLADSVLTQVVWTSTNNYISGAKLTIQVEADETGGSGQWETQVCEAIIAVRGWTNASQPVMSVYGVTHTSVAPLMTFTVQRNPSTSLIEIVGTRTGTASPNGNASLRIYSVETGTND